MSIIELENTTFKIQAQLQERMVVVRQKNNANGLPIFHPFGEKKYEIDTSQWATLFSNCVMQSLLSTSDSPSRASTNFVFMDDNTSPHKTLTVEEASEKGKILLEWIDQHIFLI